MPRPPPCTPQPAGRGTRDGHTWPLWALPLGSSSIMQTSSSNPVEAGGSSNTNQQGTQRNTMNEYSTANIVDARPRSAMYLTCTYLDQQVTGSIRGFGQAPGTILLWVDGDATKAITVYPSAITGMPGFAWLCEEDKEDAYGLTADSHHAVRYELTQLHEGALHCQHSGIGYLEAAVDIIAAMLEL